MCEAQLANLDFEAAGAGGYYSAANWVEYGAVNRELWANYTGSAGSFGMALEWWNGPSGGFYQDIATRPGAGYHLSAWCQDDAAAVSVGVYTMKLEYYDAARVLLGTDATNISAGVNNTWRQMTLTGSAAPANCATVRVVFGGSRLVEGETLKIDAVSFGPGPP